ncbi:MAG TPA: DinB family protein [Chitinophagaceae bacterium]|nr:DinB family protein [Chitinophagaceae bacterium]
MDLVGQIEKLQGMALQHFSPLGQQQLNWKPAADRWSIAQCLHHLMVSNRYYFETFDKLLDGSHRIGFFQKLNPFKKMIGRYMVKALGPQPKKKYRAPAIFRPSSSALPADIVARFSALQEELKVYFTRLGALEVESTYIASPVTGSIVYSLGDAMRIITVHEERHLQQAVNVLQHPNFPR